jgi:hypothetical protein
MRFSIAALTIGTSAFPAFVAERIGKKHPPGCTAKYFTGAWLGVNYCASVQSTITPWIRSALNGCNQFPANALWNCVGRMGVGDDNEGRTHLCVNYFQVTVSVSAHPSQMYFHHISILLYAHDR